MINLKKIIISFLILINYTAIAGSMGELITSNRFYLGIEGGNSISTNTHFQPTITYPSSQVFIFTNPENTDWTRDISAAGLGGVFVGYKWNQNVAVQFDYSYRGNYNWNTLVTEADSVFAPSIYYRFKAGNIQIQTFLIDLSLKPSVNWGGLVPYIKMGIGASYNKNNGLLVINIPVGGNALSENSLVTGKYNTNVAWNAGLGADYYFNNQFSISFGYRFVDAGKLSTGSNFVNALTGLASTVSPFEAQHIYLNEVLFTATYHFDGSAKLFKLRQ